MAVLKMKLVEVLGELDQLNTFIAHCCLNGNFAPESALHYMSGSMGFASLSEDNPFAEQLQELTDLSRTFQVNLELLDYTGYSPNNITIDGALLQQLSDSLQKLQEQRKQLLDEAKQCETQIAQFSHFEELEVPLSDVFGCEFIKVRFGHLPKMNLQKLELYEENPYVMFFPSSYDKTEAWGCYFAPVQKVDEIDRIFASLYFERMRIPDSSDTPKNTVLKLNQQIDALRREVARVDQEIQKLWDHEKHACDQLYTGLTYLNTIFDLRKFTAVKNNFFCYVGWVPINEYQAFAQKVEETKGIYIEIQDADANDTKHVPPTKLHNNIFARPYENLVEMFGLPNYKEIDPTNFLAIVFTILFGIMFADVGQGIVLIVAGILAWKLKGMFLGRVLSRCGVASTLFGFVFGSVFGNEDMLDPLYHAVGMKGKPITVMESISTVLVISVFIGVFLLLVAMCLNIYSSIKQKKYGNAIFGENGLTGMICYIGGVIFATQFMNKNIHILSNLQLGLLIGIPLVILFFKEMLVGIVQKEDWKPESWMDFLLTNFFEVIEYVLSYFSNTLSFLRVGAFVLVHAVMMMVVYTMAPANPVGHIIVLVLGNIFVICLECLLTSIQVMRLGFYEMFSRFYVGDGREFVAYSFKKNDIKKQKTATRKKQLQNAK